MTLSREEILAIKAGYELDRLVAREVFSVGERKQWIRCYYSTLIDFTGEIIEKIFTDNLLHQFFALVEEIAPHRTFPETICKAALIAKLNSR